MHAQLLEKLRPIAFAETCRFLTIQSLEFQEIWQNNSSETMWMIYGKKSEFCHGNSTHLSQNARIKSSVVNLYSCRKWVPKHKWLKSNGELGIDWLTDWCSFMLFYRTFVSSTSADQQTYCRSVLQMIYRHSVDILQTFYRHMICRWSADLQQMSQQICSRL